MTMARVVAVAALIIWLASVCVAEQMATRVIAEPGMAPDPPANAPVVGGSREFPKVNGPTTTGGAALPTPGMIEEWGENPEQMDEEDCRSLINNYFQISSLNPQDVDFTLSILDALDHCLRDSADDE